MRRGASEKQKAPKLVASGLFDVGEPDDVLLSREIHPTIIGAEAFHCPVRDGKEWDHLAMVVRQRRRPVDRALGAADQAIQLGRSNHASRLRRRVRL